MLDFLCTVSYYHVTLLVQYCVFQLQRMDNVATHSWSGIQLEITCYRDAELMRESFHLPATTYNLAQTLFSRSASGCLFVPIRSMQYLAILDTEEFVFLDGVRKCWVDIAWQNFRPQLRTTLEDPVSFQAVYYRADSAQLMSRLQAELPHALGELAKKETPHGDARILKFGRCESDHHS
jgi:hypothetical protein